VAKKITTDVIRALRDATGAPLIRAKKVLEEVGDEKKAEKILREEGFEAARKNTERKTREGLIFSYVHHTGKVASLVELLCESDFVARNKLFQELAHNLALQVGSMAFKDVAQLKSQEFIKEPTKKISDLVKEVIAKTGENVRISRIYRVELGQPAKG